MSALTLALILLSSIGFLLSGFFSVYLLVVKKRAMLDLLLGSLLLALSLRIGKSVFNNFTELPLVIKNIGLAANLAIGPLLLLYGGLLLRKYKIQNIAAWHFLPALIYLVGSPIIPNQTGDFWWSISYGFVILQQLIYLGWSARLIDNWQVRGSHSPQKGFVILWITIGLIWLTYLLIFLQLIPIYLFGALAYSLLVLLLAYLLIAEGDLFTQKEKYGPNRLSAQQSQEYLQRLQDKLLQDRDYLNPDLSIQDIARQINLPAKLISQVTNEQLKLNFSAFINNYRIEEAKNRLKANDYRQYTIASIAYDCGFNSISSFNTTFKALTKQTPSQFRKAALKKTA